MLSRIFLIVSLFFLANNAMASVPHEEDPNARVNQARTAIPDGIWDDSWTTLSEIPMFQEPSNDDEESDDETPDNVKFAHAQFVIKRLWTPLRELFQAWEETTLGGTLTLSPSTEQATAYNQEQETLHTQGHATSHTQETAMPTLQVTNLPNLDFIRDPNNPNRLIATHINTDENNRVEFYEISLSDGLAITTRHFTQTPDAENTQNLVDVELSSSLPGFPLFLPVVADEPAAEEEGEGSSEAE